MLAAEIYPRGGLRLAGSEADLRRLAEMALEAAVTGRSEAAFVTDEALSQLVIERKD